MCDHCKQRLNSMGYCKRCGEEICPACSSLTNQRIHQECLNMDRIGLPRTEVGNPYISRPFGTEIMSANIPRPFGTCLNIDRIGLPANIPRPFGTLQDIILGTDYNSNFFDTVIFPSIRYEKAFLAFKELKSRQESTLIMPLPDGNAIEPFQLVNPFGKIDPVAFREYRNYFNLSRYL